MLLNCKNIQKSYGATDILADVTFIMEEKEKVAVVGANGAGKTTLFRIIMGETAMDGGAMIKAKDARIDYLPQLAENLSDRTITEELLKVFEPLKRMEEELRRLEQSMAAPADSELEKIFFEYDNLTRVFEERGGYAYQSRVRGVVRGLGFLESEWELPVSKLSGGQKTRVALGKLLLTAPDLLLLDEPTNHLDIEAIAWLEDYLKNYEGAILVISHDRYFLDKTVGKVIEIENRKSKVYAGNYSFYARHKETDRAVYLKAYLDQRQEIKRQEEVIARLKSFNREKSIKQAESKEKRLGKMEKLDRPENLPDKMRVILSPKHPSGQDVLDIYSVSKAFGRRVLFENVSFSLKRGEKAALIGANGIGKTTLFKLIMRELPFERGEIRRGLGVRIGYYDQEHEGLHEDKSIFSEISDAYPTLTQAGIRGVLAAFVFTGDDVFKPIAALSGGERGRVALAKIMLGGANFLVLDEPTNHLDLASKEILEEALRDYSGTVLYISHDRYFINHTADKVIELTKDCADVYLGNYDFYLQKRKPEPVVSESEKRKPVKKNGGKNKQNQIIRLERDIHALEERICELDGKLSLEEVGRDAELAQQYYLEKTQLETKLMTLYNDWDQLSEEIV